MFLTVRDAHLYQSWLGCDLVSAPSNILFTTTSLALRTLASLRRVLQTTCCLIPRLAALACVTLDPYSIRRADGQQSLFWKDDRYKRRSLSAANLGAFTTAYLDPGRARQAAVTFDLDAPHRSSREWIAATLDRARNYVPVQNPCWATDFPSMTSVVSSTRYVRRSISLDSFTAFLHEDSMEVHVQRKRRETELRITGIGADYEHNTSIPGEQNHANSAVNSLGTLMLVRGADNVSLGSTNRGSVSRPSAWLDAWPRDSIRVARERRNTLRADTVEEDADECADAEMRREVSETDFDDTETETYDAPVSRKRIIGRKDTFGRKAARKLKSLFAPNIKTPTAVSTLSIE